MTEPQDQLPREYTIPGIRTDQAMLVVAAMVCSFINDQVRGDIKKGQVLFLLVVRQLASFSKEPATIATLLRVIADELDGKFDPGPAV